MTRYALFFRLNGESSFSFLTTVEEFDAANFSLGSIGNGTFFIGSTFDSEGNSDVDGLKWTIDDYGELVDVAVSGFPLFSSNY